MPFKYSPGKVVVNFGGNANGNQKTEAIKSGRRDFLKLSAVTVAAGAVATASTANASENVKVSNGDYKETEHVKKFYDLARF